MKQFLTNIKKLLLPRRIFVPVILIITGLALFLVVWPAKAGLGAILAENLILPIAQFFGNLTVTLIGILVSVAQYNYFIHATAVVKGWVMVRDVINMFFIIMILLIAFGTVFRWENYHYKKMLGKLLIAAVLVNFSKGITGFMIDFAQVIMLTFVYAFKDAAAGNFVQGFHLDKMFQFAQNTLSPEESRNLTADDNTFFVASLLALISIFITMVVVGVYLIVLIIRIVVLWFLIITSPIAFSLNIFPGDLKKYADQWWNYFGKYVTTGPILAFFLWLSLYVMQITSGNVEEFTTVKDSGPGLADVPGAAITAIGQSDVLLSFIVNIGLLVGALIMTQQAGVAGGKLAGAALQGLRTGGAKLVKAPFKGIGAVAKLPLGAAKNWYKEKAPAWLQPVAVWKGIQARGKEKGEQAEAISTARGRQFYTRFITRGKQRIPYEQIASHRIKMGYVSEIGHLPKEQKAFLMKKAWDMSGPEGRRIRSGLLTASSSEGHIDDVLDSPFIRHQAKWTDAQGVAHQGFQQPEPDGTYSDYERINQLLYAALSSGERGKGGITEDDLGTIFDIGEIGRKIGHPEYYGHDGFNSVTGRYINRRAGVNVNAAGVDMNLDAASDEAVGEIVKLDLQTQLRMHPHVFQRQVTRPGNVTWGEEDQYLGRKVYDTIFAGAQTNEVTRRSTSRLSYLLGTYNAQDEMFTMDQAMVNSLQRRWNLSEKSRDNLRALFTKANASHINVVDGAGGIVENYNGLDSLDQLARAHGGAGGFTPPPMWDINQAKQNQTKQVLDEFEAKSDNKGKDFFATPEYQAGKDQYYTKEEYYDNEGLQRWQKEQGKGGMSVKQFARGQKSEISVDFSKLGLKDLEGRAGVNISAQQDIASVAGTMVKILNEEITKLEAKEGETQSDTLRLGYMRQAKEKFEYPEAINNLSLYNTGRAGVSARRLITHENQHAALAALDPDESIQQDIWQKLHTVEERKQIIEQVRKKQSALDMPEDEARREYFAEGLTNETQWGDKSPTAIKLKPGVRNRLAEAAAGVRIEQPAVERPVQRKPVPSTAEAEPTTVTGQVQVALENTINIQGGFGNLLSELAKPSLQQEQFFKPLLQNLRKEFSRLFDQQTSLSGDMLNLKDKLANRLAGLEKMLSSEADRSQFADKFRSFLNEFGGIEKREDKSETPPSEEESAP
ncbi:MAG: hypothetical protein V1712_01865 [Patescibacteria group bacterium]